MISTRGQVYNLYLTQHDLILLARLKTAVGLMQAFKANHFFTRLFIEGFLSQCKKVIKKMEYTKQRINSDIILNEIISIIDDKIQSKIPGVITDLLVSVRAELTRFDIRHPVFVQPKEKLSRQEVQLTKINRICFRGDDRPPKVIFAEGFKSFDNGVEVINSLFESESDNVVAFSSRFAAATFFPLNTSKNHSYVYVVKLKEGFDVHKHGYNASVQDGLNEESATLLFVDEIITYEVPPEDIVAAVEITRFPWKTAPLPEYLTKDESRRTSDDVGFIDFYLKCGSYLIQGYQMNPNCSLPSEEKIRVKDFLINEIKNSKDANGFCQIPMPTSGYLRNTLFSDSTQNKKSADVSLVEERRESPFQPSL